MARFDSGIDRPPRIVVDLVGRGHHPGACSSPVNGAAPDLDLVVDLADTAEIWREVVRVQAADLREAQRRGAEARADVVASGRDPADISVLVEVAVMIADDAPSARRRLAELDAATDEQWRPRSMLYVGTATGLAGLIADMHAVGIADGVALQPLSLPDVLAHIAFETIPWLESLGAPMSRQGVRLLREHGVPGCAEAAVGVAERNIEFARQ